MSDNVNSDVIESKVDKTKIFNLTPHDITIIDKKNLWCKLKSVGNWRADERMPDYKISAEWSMVPHINDHLYVAAPYIYAVSPFFFSAPLPENSVIIVSMVVAEALKKQLEDMYKNHKSLSKEEIVGDFMELYTSSRSASIVCPDTSPKSVKRDENGQIIACVRLIGHIIGELTY